MVLIRWPGTSFRRILLIRFRVNNDNIFEHIFSPLLLFLVYHSTREREKYLSFSYYIRATIIQRCFVTRFETQPRRLTRKQ